MRHANGPGKKREGQEQAEGAGCVRQRAAEAGTRGKA